jgi:hypothetical protein
VKRLFLGKGTFIPADSIAEQSFLRGQDVMPREVTRYIAESFRFRRGFMAPMPGYHEGDIRVPQTSRRTGPQPFVVYSVVNGTPASSTTTSVWSLLRKRRKGSV